MKNTCMRAISTILIASFLACTTGACFGRFELTRKIYRFNQTVSKDKWVRWLMFLVLALLPYGIGLLVDVLFANSVEFWTGSNPVAAGTTRSVTGPDGSFAQATKQADGSVLLEAADGKGAQYSYVLRYNDTGMQAYDSAGRLVASASDDARQIKVQP